MKMKRVIFTKAPGEQETSLNLISRGPGPAEKSATTVPSAAVARAKPKVPVLTPCTGLATNSGVSPASVAGPKAGEAKVKVASTPLRSTLWSAVSGRATE